ncbi:hypothetical protein KSC_070660 [Ktedonobacter sp. SOSP1-52]|uniref:DUF6368 family protein n=1 Tax=Ktedonobacter sp. SOSP1-52 TaxID=2778366 RepID=UPI001915D46F|nr:DUF6368 family protein [Ktedonobacter sp. SOSP1-52]GHO68174.1 hypothetical protein KSC_070660 [Ktedonobacter sp. SOSP1-52]
MTQEQTEELDAWLHSIAREIEVKGKLFNTRERTLWLKPDIFPEEVSFCIFYFSIEDGAVYADEESECEQFQTQIGYLPSQAIGFSSGCNQNIDHRTLGLLTLQLAERYNGLISMDGAITPPLKPNPTRAAKFKETLARSEGIGAFFSTRYEEINKELAKNLPPGKTLKEMAVELFHQPDSPYARVQKEAEEKFGSLSALNSWRPSLVEVSTFVHSLPGKVYEFPYMTGNNELWVSHIVNTTFLRAWLEHLHFHMIK